MILVAVGNAPQSFNRLLRFIDNYVQWCGAEVIYQTGYSSYYPKTGRVHKFISPSQLNQLIFTASSVVIHGGSGLFDMAISAGKLPIMCPRRIDLFEHTDPSQVEFVNFLHKKNLCIKLECIESDEDFSEMLFKAEKSKINFQSEKFYSDVRHAIEQ